MSNRWWDGLTRNLRPYLSRGRATRSGVALPWVRQGGQHFRDNAAFLESAVAEARRVHNIYPLDENSAVVDFGCGSGRLAIGMIEAGLLPESYIGVEVQADQVRWAQRHITKHDRRFEFVHVDAPNRRYNLEGESARELPLASSRYSIFYAYSVFSHMAGDEIVDYLLEARRILRSDGKAIVTAFVEPGVPPEEENPADYGPPNGWYGPLHCVRYSLERFRALCAETNLEVIEYRRQTDTDGQSLMVLAPCPPPNAN